MLCEAFGNTNIRGFKLKILHIAPYFPSKNAVHAGGVCMAHEIETLKALGHTVYSCTFYQKQYDANCLIEDENYYTVKLTKIKKIINCLLHPFTAPYFASRFSGAFYRRLVKIIKSKKIEAIHAEYAAMGLYVKLKKKFPNLKFNLVLHDVTYQSYLRKFESSRGLKRLLYSVNKKLVFKNEKSAVDKADCILTFCDKDSKLVKQYYNPKQVKEINTYFGLDKVLKYDFQASYYDRQGICFMGQMGRKENEEAAIRLITIYNQIKGGLLDNKLYIFGSHPSEKLKSYASNDVEIFGYVENLEETMSKCKVAVFPLMSGAGIKIKVLTSMALGIPTITTDVGAEGIDEQGEYLVLANDDEVIKQKLLELVNNASIYNEVSDKIARYVIEKFSWQQTIDVFSELYR